MKRHQIKQRSGKVEENGAMHHHHDSVSFLLGISKKSNADKSEVDQWRMECMDMVAEALLPPLGDKSQAVRNSVIQACTNLKNILKNPSTYAFCGTQFFICMLCCSAKFFTTDTNYNFGHH
eukprot:3547652-Ditylum_brightwellii.AAC.1